jgi:hypothetical protein
MDLPCQAAQWLTLWSNNKGGQVNMVPLGWAEDLGVANSSETSAC